MSKYNQVRKDYPKSESMIFFFLNLGGWGVGGGGGGNAYLSNPRFNCMDPPLSYTCSPSLTNLSLCDERCAPGNVGHSVAYAKPASIMPTVYQVVLVWSGQ